MAAVAGAGPGPESGAPSESLTCVQGPKNWATGPIASASPGSWLQSAAPETQTDLHLASRHYRHNLICCATAKHLIMAIKIAFISEKKSSRFIHVKINYHL